MAYEEYEGEIAGESGYDVVGAIMQTAQAKGIPMTAQKATAIARLLPRPVVPRAIVQGRKTGMTTGLPLGNVNLAAATIPTAVVQLAQVCQERFIARRLIVWRGNQGASLAVSVGTVGQSVLVMDVRVGQRSVLAGGAGVPVEVFAPTATGGGLLAGGVEVPEGKTVTVQFQYVGPGNIAANESINLSAYLSGEE